MDREFDVILFGASGFTGQVVARYFAQRDGHQAPLRWAMAGRNPAKLAAIRAALNCDAVPIVTADVADSLSIVSLVKRARLVVSTAGPYLLYGTALVTACAAHGTDYIDITGESNWIQDMLAHEGPARASGSRIVFSCGFDSIPFDLGVLYLQDLARARWGIPAPAVHGRIRKLHGGVRPGMSGGAIASGIAIMEAMQRDPRVLASWFDPFALTPGFRGPAQPDSATPRMDPVLGSWLVPFALSPINCKTIHRSNFLLRHPWSVDFRYDELLLSAAPPSADPGPNPLLDPNRPAPGEGPSDADREGGCYEILFIGEGPDGNEVRVSVAGDSDAGVDSTARMLKQAALCLCDIPREELPGGMWTPASAFGRRLLEPLARHAGITCREID